MVQVVECLTIKSDTLSSIPSNAKNKTKTKQTIII
jgi:hypothetical protein